MTGVVNAKLLPQSISRFPSLARHQKNSRGWAPRASRFFSCFYRALLTHYTLSVEREYTTHTNTTPQHAASQACLLAATRWRRSHSGFCLRAFAASPLESAVKQVGGSGGARDGGGGIRVGDAEVCAHVVRGGRCTPRIRPGGGEESDGDGGGRDRGSGGDPGMVATAASAMQPASCRRGEVTGGRDRCALLEYARQSSSDAAW